MVTIAVCDDKKQWQNFLDKTYHGFYPFFQTWDWGEVMDKSGFKITRLGVWDKNSLVGVCQIIDINARRGHYLHLRQGPVLLDGTKYLPELLAYIKAVAQHVSFLRVSPLISREYTAYFKALGFRQSLMHAMDAEICWVLDITKQEEELLANMRKTHRYLIRKAPSVGVTIEKSTNPDDMHYFTPLYHKLATKMKFVPHKSIKEEFEVLSKDNQEVLFMAKYQGKIISTAFIAFVGPMAIYRHSASDDAYRNIPASYLIQWEAIKEAKKRGLKYYNFWGVAPTDDPKHPWQGFTLFKTGFGGEKKEFLHAMDLPLTPLYWKNYLADWIDKLNKGY